MPTWLLVLALVSAADVPIDIQLPAFLKALGFERNLQIESDKLVIGIVYDPSDDESSRTVDRILATHKQLTRLRVKGKRVDFVPIAYTRGTPLELAGSRVLFAAPLPDEAVAHLAKQSEEANLLVFSTTSGNVDRGLAVGMELSNGKPVFVVNLAAARSAGASFEAGFLALCRIVEH